MRAHTRTHACVFTLANPSSLPSLQSHHPGFSEERSFTFPCVPASSHLQSMAAPAAGALDPPLLHFSTRAVSFPQELPFAFPCVPASCHLQSTTAPAACNPTIWGILGKMIVRFLMYSCLMPLAEHDCPSSSSPGPTPPALLHPSTLLPSSPLLKRPTPTRWKVRAVRQQPLCYVLYPRNRAHFVCARRHALMSALCFMQSCVLLSHPELV